MAPRAVHAHTDGTSSSERTSSTVLQDGDLSVSITKRIKVATNEKGEEIRDDSSETKVKLAGKEVPADRVRTTGSTLEILDEKGAVIRSIELPDVEIDANARFSTRRGFAFSPSGPVAGPTKPGHAGSWSAGAMQAGTPSGEAPTVMLGVTMETPDGSLAKHLKVNPDESTVILTVTPDLPAAKAGLQQFDIVVRVDDEAAATPNTIRKVLRTKEPGDAIRFQVLSGGDKKDVVVTLEAWDPTKLGSAALGTGAMVSGADLPIMDAQVRMLLDRLVDPSGAPVILDDFFAPGSPSARNGVFRFAVPGTPSAHSTVDSDRLRILEERIDDLNETLQRLEQRLRNSPLMQPVQPPQPAPAGPRT